jgi:glyoxylase-like metal-dependent hydrolase (beta-lactamase superfamily II)
MIAQVLPDIFQIRVPLPQNPLGHINSYLLKSGEKNLLIDTGLNFPTSFQALCKGLSEVGVKPGQLDQILLTHFHVDHVGLIPRIKEMSKNVELFIHPTEAEMSKLMLEDFGSYRLRIENFLETNGAPLSIAKRLQNFHPAFFTPQAYQELAKAASPVKDGQEILIGNYGFQVLWTPGHSPGHICLHEPSKRVLFSGDHLLPTITSHVAQFMENMDPLTDYLGSLEKIEKLNIGVVFPAHEEAFTSHRERIKELKVHHRQRLTEIVDELEKTSLTAYMLASKLHWDVNYESWEEFPSFQKYLALGETLAHLKVLEKKQLVKRAKVGELIFYEKVMKPD